jgi:flavin reductase (DIM6/NTAB) family NADH-FMN oxidoreductase RutF
MRIQALKIRQNDSGECVHSGRPRTNAYLEDESMHKTIEPGILYLGTPVVLISTVNENGTYNLAPMSSAFWLGWRCVLGLGARSKTPQNMRRTGECVLNLPSVDIAGAVNRLALTTGSNPVPDGKIRRGYRHEQRVHVDETILMSGESDRIDPDKWRPLIMSFQQFYGLGANVHESVLGTIPESAYRGPDIERARKAVKFEAAVGT